MNPSFSGRGVGAIECTTPDRLEEVARLVTIGYKPGEIGQSLGITTVRARQLVLKAKAEGLVEVLQAERNRVARKMDDTRAKIAEVAFQALQKRLKYVVGKDGSDIDARDMKEAREALELTEYTSEFIKPTGQQASVQVAIFNGADVEKASKASEVVLGQ